MSLLNPQPGSSSPAQRQKLALAARRRGWTIDDLRREVGGKLHALSAQDASDWIQRLTGQPLANPPGEKPSVYAGSRAAPGVIRMITQDQVEQIARMGVEYFGGFVSQFIAWLAKDFKISGGVPSLCGGIFPIVRQLATAQRAAQVIRVLKTMNARKAVSHQPSAADAPEPSAEADADADAGSEMHT